MVDHPRVLLRLEKLYLFLSIVDGLLLNFFLCFCGFCLFVPTSICNMSFMLLWILVKWILMEPRVLHHEWSLVEQLLSLLANLLSAQV